MNRIIISGIVCIVAASKAWTPIVVKDVTLLGPQVTPDVTNVSRDGGFSALINGKIVWLYDDTECFDLGGKQLSFVSNTAAYADEPDRNISKVADFGVVEAGQDGYGRKQYAILADTAVGSGGWISFQFDELNFNHEMSGKRRVAIWPGASPTPISTTQAFLYAPLVYVDMKPQDPSKEYQARGMTLITITALVSGPIATRLGDLVIPGQEIAYGGFATLLGFVSSAAGETSGDRDVYTIGTTRGGLQLARVGLNDITDFNKYSFFDPKSLHFLTKPPPLSLTDSSQIYLPGSFSSGNIFFSPYFGTFILIYFNKFVDSTFYIRFLDLDDPRENDVVWTEGGKNGQGIRPEDVEALVKYEWSPEQKLYASPRGQGGFNYAGNAHPEYFNRQYFAKSLYPDHVEKGKRINDWYGSALLTETDAEADGKCLLLSWTAQIQTSKDTGIYQPQLAVLCFDSIPIKPGSSDPPASVTHIGNIPTTPVSPPQSTSTHKSIDMDLNMVPKSWLARGNTLSSFLGHNGYANSGLWDVVGTLMVLFGVVLLGALVL